MEYRLRLKVNGSPVETNVEPAVLLLDFVRDQLGLTGTKEGCGTGDCGACTVLVDGMPVHSCLTLACEAENTEVTTIEGLANNGQLHPIQAAFAEMGGLQCGYCTPGFILMAKGFLETNPNPNEDQIRMGIAGNLCRCTGYDRIVAAIQAVAAGREFELAKPGATSRVPLPPEPEGE
jgi:aerobic carbon-monoxide dehydrogenase small subunit